MAKKVDKTLQVFAALDQLRTQNVLVGITQEKASRPGEPINNAELAFIHENGSPVRNIPARPIFHPAINANIDKINILQAKIFEATLKGDNAGAMKAMNALGFFAQSACQKWFTDPRNNWAPNAPATIAAKGSERPLIDTDEFRNAITYVIRPK